MLSIYLKSGVIIAVKDVTFESIQHVLQYHSDANYIVLGNTIVFPSEIQAVQEVE